jgi:hypothetical protein
MKTAGSPRRPTAFTARSTAAPRSPRRRRRRRGAFERGSMPSKVMGDRVLDCGLLNAFFGRTAAVK